MRTLRWLLVLLSALVVLSGCGISAEGDPRVLDVDGAPFAQTTETPSPEPSGDTQTTIYLVRASDRKLTQRSRFLPAVPTPEELLQRLVAGPVDDEGASGFLTAVPDGVRVVPPAEVKGTAKAPAVRGAVTVEFPETGRTDEVLAFGQIVLTLSRSTQVPGGVQFSRDGQIIEVPGDDGRPRAGPLTTADYRGLIATD